MSIVLWLVCCTIAFILTWGFFMYGLWRISKKDIPSTAQEPEAVIAHLVRYTRRGAYSIQRCCKQFFTMIKKGFSKVFVAVFPNAKRAFRSIDPLTGLEEGPSSYFLLELSSDAKKTIRKERTVRKKRIPSSEHLSSNPSMDGNEN